MFEVVEQFEKEISNFFGSQYAVATDCCTHAIELCLRYTKSNDVCCPTNTYISIPFTFKKLNLTWNFKDIEWQDYYFIGNTNIIDAAVLWKQISYIPNTLMCLSFQFKKHLSLGRGGAILCDNYSDYVALKKLSYDGRFGNAPWAEQDITSVGYHYYMTPETALLGLEKLTNAIETVPASWSHNDYPYLPNMAVFNVQ
jgi:dTDP-4-amino-4,6-dideoxygalactose transaminase